MEVIELNDFCKTYIVKNGDNCIIIDAGVPVEDIEKNVKGLKISGIFITHAHFDHIAFLQDYVNKFNARVFISDNGYFKLYDAEKNLSQMYSHQPLELTINIDYVPLQEGKILIDNFDITAIETQGHSNCSYSFLIEDTIFVGDLIFENGVGRTDFYDGNSKTLVASIQKLKQYKQIRKIKSGH